MPTSIPVIDRASLVDALGVKLDIEGSVSRATSIRIGVDTKLARLLGARVFLGRDWNFWRRPVYSLDDIGARLSTAGLTISAQDLVEERLRVNREWYDYYYFERVLDRGNVPGYRLAYHREEREKETY
jgi:hypothetical protein